MGERLTGEQTPADGYEVRICAPARLHMGFMDPSGRTASTFGNPKGAGEVDRARRFGGAGLALEHPQTIVKVTRHCGITAEGEHAERAQQYAARIARQIRLPSGVAVTVQEAIPAHTGLGSGTQLALAVGVGICELFGLQLSTARVAELLGRGARSGIGVGAFDLGGFLVDGGRGVRDRPPPIVSRMPFPSDWRLLLVFDTSASGVAGEEEKDAFKRLPPFSHVLASHLCRLTLLEALPALAEHDLDCFGEAISELQAQVGDYFAPIQGGRYASKAVGSVLDWAGAQHYRARGQSSWGPTGFIVCRSARDAQDLRLRAETQFGDQPSLSFMVCQARNAGGTVSTGTDQLHPATEQVATR